MMRLINGHMIAELCNKLCPLINAHVQYAHRGRICDNYVMINIKNPKQRHKDGLYGYHVCAITIEDRGLYLHSFEATSIDYTSCDFESTLAAWLTECASKRLEAMEDHKIVL